MSHLKSPIPKYLFFVKILLKNQNTFILVHLFCKIIFKQKHGHPAVHQCRAVKRLKSCTFGLEAGIKYFALILTRDEGNFKVSDTS